MAGALLDARATGSGRSGVADEQITALLAAARQRGSATLVILLLALDAGLRVSVICALKWDDIDLRAGTELVQRSVYEGVEQAKGKIGKIAPGLPPHPADRPLARGRDPARSRGRSRALWQRSGNRGNDRLDPANSGP